MNAYNEYLNEHGQTILDFLMAAYGTEGRGAGLMVAHDNDKSRLAYYTLEHIIEDDDPTLPHVEQYDPEREAVLIVGRSGKIHTYILRQAGSGRVQVGQVVGPGSVAWGHDHLVKKSQAGNQ